MYEKTGNRTTARALIALLAVALVFTMMPLTMGKVFAAEDGTVSGLMVTGDVAQDLNFKDMKEMKNNEAVKAATKKEVPVHWMNKKLTEGDVVVDGITLEDLIGIAGLKSNAKLIGVSAFSGVDEYEAVFTKEQIEQQDLQGNKAMFTWKMIDGGIESKVQTVVRGQMTQEDINKSSWITDTAVLIVDALDKPVVTVKAGKKKATVKWGFDVDAEQFVVLRSTKKSGKYSKVKVVKGKTSFTDKKVKKGKTYYYKVQAVAGDLNNTSAAKKVKVK